MTGKRSIQPGRGKRQAEGRRDFGGAGGGESGAGPRASEHSLAVWFLRAIHNWTQQELAQASGVHQSRISLYEAGRRTPSRATLERLAAGARFPMYLLDRLIDVFRSALAAAGLALPAPPPEEEEHESSVAEEVARAVSAAVHVALAELAAETRAPSLARWAAAERALAPRRWELLAPFSPEEQRFLVENAQEHRSFALCERICEESAGAATEDPERALALADLALFIAERVEGGETWRLRLQGYAWAFAGNARRAAGDPAGAEDAFARSRELWDAGAAADSGILDAARVGDLALPVTKVT